MLRFLTLFCAIGLFAWAGCGSTALDEGDDSGPLSRTEAIAVREAREEAWRLHGEGDMGAALELLEKWDGSAEAGSICLEIAADICMEQAQPAMAVLYLTRAAEGRPEDPTLLLKKGDALMRAGKEEEAEIALRQCLSFDWNHDRAKILLAELLFAAGYAQKANAYLDAVDSAHDWDVRSLLLLGAIRGSMGLKDEALRHFDTAHRAAPQMAEPFFNKGRLLEESGDTAGAVSAYREALERDGEHVPSLFNLGCLLIGSQHRSEGELLVESACEAETDPLLKKKMEETKDRLKKKKVIQEE